MLVEIIDMNRRAATYPKHASRLHASEGFTTFLVYDYCKNEYTKGKVSRVLASDGP